MPRLYPETLLDFQRLFPDEAHCLAYMEALRWPQGFVCPYCGWAGEPFRFASRPKVLRCRACERDVSLLAGTVMDKAHTPLQVWFWAAYLVTSQTPGMSALQFQRQLGIRTYETAFQMLHKLRAAMVRPERDRIGGEYPVEVDEGFVGGKTKGEGRGKTHKRIVAVAVEFRERQTGLGERLPRETHERGIPTKRRYYAGRLRLRYIGSRGAGELIPFVLDSVEPGSIVHTDGLQAYNNLRTLGYDHEASVVDADPDALNEWLPISHLVISNLKTWLQGTHHGVSPQHLQAYLNEYAFRFNRRFYPLSAFNSVLGIAATVQGPTYDELYRSGLEGGWVHPNPDFGADMWDGVGYDATGEGRWETTR